MFTQLFGKYLVEENVITDEDNRALHDKMFKTRVKLGTIAIAEGILDEKQVEGINHMQTQQDKRFGDIAIELAYITEEQLEEMLKKQGSAALKYYQLLNEDKNIPMEDIDIYIENFQKKFGFNDDELEAIRNDDYDMLISFFAPTRDNLIKDLSGLVMRNLTRFVSGDFYFGRMKKSADYSYGSIAGQSTSGDCAIYLGFAAKDESEGIIELAKGYAKEVAISSSDEVYDALCEFTNLNNGLLASELSEHDEFSDMNPPQVFLGQSIKGTAYVMPIYIHDKQFDMVISTDPDFAPGANAHKLNIKDTDNREETKDAKGRILVVDDSHLIRKMLGNLLNKNGYAVAGEAANGQEAVDIYTSLKPDIVTLDVTMPVMDGVEALKKIKEIDKDAKIIMVTAAGQKERIVEAIKAGANAFITKPFDEDDLIKNINYFKKQS